jgi:hypothetical protein
MAIEPEGYSEQHGRTITRYELPRMMSPAEGTTPAKSVFQFGIFHPGRQKCIDSIDSKRSTVIVAPSYQLQHRSLVFFDRSSAMKRDNQLLLNCIIRRCS